MLHFVLFCFVYIFFFSSSETSEKHIIATCSYNTLMNVKQSTHEQQNTRKFKVIK